MTQAQYKHLKADGRENVEKALAVCSNNIERAEREITQLEKFMRSEGRKALLYEEFLREEG
jgi:hypothetical protein